LSEDEINELKIHGFKKTKFPNLYKCRYNNDSPLVLLLKRTNHAWYFTTKNKNEITNKEEIENNSR